MSIEPTADSVSAAAPAAAAGRPERALDELHAASNRLWYEYWMLRCAARTPTDDPATASALEEAFALHLRNLYRFLYAATAGTDSLTAEDFLGDGWRALRPQPSPLLADAVAWAEQTLAAPRFAQAGATGAPRFWSLLQASFELQKVMDPFISNLPRHMLGARWKVVYEHGLAV